jgi:hypothetical protein
LAQAQQRQEEDLLEEDHSQTVMHLDHDDEERRVRSFYFILEMKILIEVGLHMPVAS